MIKILKLFLIVLTLNKLVMLTYSSSDSESDEDNQYGQDMKIGQGNTLNLNFKYGQGNTFKSCNTFN
jgi:hypothetical protein